MLFNYRYLMVERFSARLEEEFRKAYGNLDVEYAGFV
jgi:hypothetical protein